MTELETRADKLFHERLDATYRRTDRLFAALMVGQWICAIAIALWISPYSWAGKQRSLHFHVQLAVGLGFVITSAPVALALLRPGWSVTRYTIAVAQVLWSALLIHLTGGRLETHFHVFGSLAFLAFYRDWRVLVPATIVVAADHMIRQFYWPESVFGMSSPESWRFLEHAGWVLFEDFFLVIACITSVNEVKKIAEQNVRIETTERAARELEIAATIQTSMLPRDVNVAGLEVSAKMQAADEVGGDYYDVLPVDDGCWIAIGDVAGHGIRAGLTMLQAQAALAALVRRSPHAPAAEIWAGLNATFFDTVRNRLRHDEHMTMSLLRYRNDGVCEVVGAHEEIIVWRKATSVCEIIPLSGTWIGVSADPHSESHQLVLSHGDVVVLYTDGIIEAREQGGKMLGIEPVRDTVARLSAQPADEIRDAIFDLTRKAMREDDASVVVLRYTGVALSAAA